MIFFNGNVCIQSLLFGWKFVWIMRSDEKESLGLEWYAGSSQVGTKCICDHGSKNGTYAFIYLHMLWTSNTSRNDLKQDFPMNFGILDCSYHLFL